jgi:transcriptional regulator with XRE-family HTH domain
MSLPGLNGRVVAPARSRTVKRMVDSALRRVLEDIERARIDAGWTRRRLCLQAGVDPAHYSRMLAGQRVPSMAALAALTSSLEGDLAVRFYPRTGPTIHDRHQAAMVEAVLEITHARYRRSVEVRVTRPVRGSIDLTLDDPDPPVIIATEVQSRIDRLEQFLRWTNDKVAALPSADIWPMFDTPPTVHRLLVLRSTSATRDLAHRFGQTLRAAYPAPASAAYAALTTSDTPWPWSAILWADVRGGVARVMPRPPRGVALGR